MSTHGIFTSILLVAATAASATAVEPPSGVVSLGRWLDRSRDGIRQEIETEPLPLSDPRLERWDGTSWMPLAALPSQVGGRWMWSYLEPGQYRGVYTTVSIFSFTALHQGSDAALDSDVDAAGFVMLTVANGATATADAGYLDRHGTISLGRWLDRSRDGVRQDIENLEPVPVSDPRIERWDGVAWMPVTTYPQVVNGRWEWPMVEPGDYRAIFPTISIFAYATKDQGGDDTLDSDVDASGMVLLTVDGATVAADAGYLDRRGTISLGRWLDRSRDGVRQDLETETVSVADPRLDRWDGISWMPVTTYPQVVNGRWEWMMVDPGQYRAVFPTVSIFGYTTANQGGDDARDSDVDATGMAVVMVDSQTVTVDAGYVDRRGSISLGRWLDANRDGVRQTGETLPVPMPDPRLERWDGVTWTSVMTTPALTGGRWVWLMLDPGRYRTVYLTNAYMGLTIPDQGGDDALDSDVDAAGRVELVVEGALLSADAGYIRRTGTITGRVWFDGEGDGLQDAGEPGQAGTSVELRTTAGSVMATMTTDASGSYIFTNLNPATYVIAIPSLVGRITLPDQGSDDLTDSDLSISGQLTVSVAPDAIMRVDAGIANQAPVVLAPAVTVAEDSTGALNPTATDPDSDPVTWEVTTLPTHGILIGSAPLMTYQPVANWSGSDAVEVTVRDAWGRSTLATIVITVTPVNDAPTLPALNLATTANTAVSGTLSGADVEGDALSYQVVSVPNLGVATITGDRLDYQPDANAVGTDVLTVQVIDAAGGVGEATVTVVITGAGMPVPWAQATVGTITPVPTAAYDWLAARFSIASAGVGLTAKADACSLLSQPIAGDVTIIAQVVTQTGTAAARAGLIFRESTAVGSRTAAVLVNPTGALSFVRRTTTNGSLATTSGGTPTPARRWLKLQRVGNTITASSSVNGTTWVVMGTATVTMNAVIQVGMIDAGGKNGGVSTAGFSGLQVILPPPSGNG